MFFFCLVWPSAFNESCTIKVISHHYFFAVLQHLEKPDSLWCPYKIKLLLGVKHFMRLLFACDGSMAAFSLTLLFPSGLIAILYSFCVYMH